MRQNAPTVVLLAGIASIPIVCAFISVAEIRPPGEAEMLTQIELEDSYLCETFGMETGSRKFQDCMSKLANLRRRHMEMVAHYDFP
jgi:hypothetical protein